MLRGTGPSKTAMGKGANGAGPKGETMGLFYADSVVLRYSNIEAAKQWWIATFGCKVMRVPPDWDNPLPSDVALTLPGDSQPTILLSAQSEVEQARFDRRSLRPPGRLNERDGLFSTFIGDVSTCLKKQAVKVYMT
jgi:hypothetical protein